MFAPSQRFVSVFFLEWCGIKFGSPGSLACPFQILRLMERHWKMLIVSSFTCPNLRQWHAERGVKWLECSRLQRDLGYNARTVYGQINAMVLVTKHHAETTSLKNWLPPFWMERSKELWLGDEGTVGSLAHGSVLLIVVDHPWNSDQSRSKRLPTR